MKKILTLALCVGVCGSVFAQKAVVDQAAKMSGKSDKLTEARELIKQAAANPETQNDARTYFVAGKLEMDAYDKARTKQMINPKDESVNPEDMAEQLVAAYGYFIKALPLDTVVDEKGKVKAKYSKDMIKSLNGHYNDYFNAGATFYGNKKYFPEAYSAFMVYGDLPSWAHADKTVKATADSLVNTAYFNAGLSAYAGNALKEAAHAFKKARLNNSTNPQNYIYELACWQYMAQKDSTLQEPARIAIEEIAKDGYKKFGISQMLFVNNLVNSYVQENRGNEALDMINELLQANPDNAALYGLRGFVYDRMEKDDESLADYRKAASISNADFDTLKNASRKIFKSGTEKWNAIEGNAPEARNDIKVNYFEAAKAIAERAKSLNPNDSDVDYILENIDYALTTYFNK